MSSTWLPPMNGSCLMFLGSPQWIGLVSIYLLINERSKDNLQRQIVLKFKKNSSRIADNIPPPQVCLKLNKKISLMASHIIEEIRHTIFFLGMTFLQGHSIVFWDAQVHIQYFRVLIFVLYFRPLLKAISSHLLDCC